MLKGGEIEDRFSKVTHRIIRKMLFIVLSVNQKIIVSCTFKGFEIG